MPDVKAVILARGLATRMRASSASGEDDHLSPEQSRMAAAGLKAMMPIADGTGAGTRPFLDYVLSALVEAGYPEIGLVIGPEHDEIRRRYERDAPPSTARLHWLVERDACQEHHERRAYGQPGYYAADLGFTRRQLLAQTDSLIR